MVRIATASATPPAPGTHLPSMHPDACATAAHRPKVPFPPSERADEAVGQRRQRVALRGVSETSAEAFHSLPVADYLAPKELAILALFTGPQVRLSRQQIAQAVPMLINGVCGRVDSLLAAGHLEESGERRRDPATGKSQKLLQLPRDRQASLEGVAP